MGEDTSLDDFLDGESGEQPAADEESTGEAESASEAGQAEEPATGGGAEPADATASSVDVEPAATTYAWSDEGTTCDDCGETVERRWQQAGELVCVECKDWEQP